jgi:hypothetical protein
MEPGNGTAHFFAVNRGAGCRRRLQNYLVRSGSSGLAARGKPSAKEDREPDAAGDFKTTWFGRAALGWRHEANPQPKKIGYSAEADLCHVFKEPLQAQLSPIIRGQFLDVFDKQFRMVITLQARGVEADSNILRVEISWNGKWADDKDEMKRDFVIKDVMGAQQTSTQKSRSR